MSAQPLRRLPRGPYGPAWPKDLEGLGRDALQSATAQTIVERLRRNQTEPRCASKVAIRGVVEVAVRSAERQAELKPPSPPASSPKQSRP